eukprot:scaffold21670_cov110-Isochrysis_galbana.AAC.3
MEVSPNWEGTGKINLNFLREDLPMKKKSTGRSLSGLCSLPCLLLALKAQWQVPETGHGPHRRSFRVFDKSAICEDFAADVDV